MRRFMRLSISAEAVTCRKPVSVCKDSMAPNLDERDAIEEAKGGVIFPHGLVEA